MCRGRILCNWCKDGNGVSFKVLMLLSYVNVCKCLPVCLPVRVCVCTRYKVNFNLEKEKEREIYVAEKKIAAGNS